jgi:hypothetical protein
MRQWVEMVGIPDFPQPFLQSPLASCPLPLALGLLHLLLIVDTNESTIAPQRYLLTRAVL